MRIKLDIRETGTRYDYQQMRDFTGDFEALRKFTEKAAAEIMAEARRLQEIANIVEETFDK